jgi:hypothetical protein
LAIVASIAPAGARASGTSSSTKTVSPRANVVAFVAFAAFAAFAARKVAARKSASTTAKLDPNSFGR